MMDVRLTLHFDDDDMAALHEESPWSGKPLPDDWPAWVKDWARQTVTNEVEILKGRQRGESWATQGAGEDDGDAK